ncbi:acyl-CoA dehydrogenase family protein [[Mycobacterium] wendilense]|uniref:Acyl-CoA dehydrogenase family protein n=1 Tax=[Mycobacterium] wendilense TaxID=3064284 RepID=A0ABM9MIJ4_9MYCO|nr:acyl-CoA dehydrogenase family protein [Mycolicibacterium sp. MU0050]CAJ1586060.1 acyl-CoA dehydrogenase family protein [Mycolicibacterium sp. MU0050]
MPTDPMPVQTSAVRYDPVRAEQHSDEDFRALIRGFLSDHHPGRPPHERTERLEWQKRWLAMLFDAGFAGPNWPREFGGMDLSFGRQLIYQEEYARAKVPGPLGNGVGIAAPTIMRYGTKEQQRRFLGPMLRGDRVWCQGFSEPEAGSDLPALRTTARRDGDHYVVNGQKVWTSHVDHSDTVYALVRTGAPESRQDGISYLIIDLDTPGVTARPIRDLSGGTAFGEVFFDDVRVPVDNRLGEENRGWKIARTSLGNERAAGALKNAAMYRRVLDELRTLVQERGAVADPGIRDGLVELEMRLRIMQYSAERTVASIMTAGEPGPAASGARLRIAQYEQDIHEFALDVLGVDGLVTKPSPRAVQRGRWLTGFLRTRASTVGTGTTEIQKNTLAEQVLGMPRDPAMPP